MFDLDVTKSILEACLAHYHINVVLPFDTVADVVCYGAKDRKIEAIKVLRTEVAPQTTLPTLRPCLAAVRVVIAYFNEVR